MAKASSCILDLSGRLQDLETSLKKSRSQESKLLKDLEENKVSYKEARHEVTQLKGTLLKVCVILLPIYSHSLEGRWSEDTDIVKRKIRIMEQ